MSKNNKKASSSSSSLKERIKKHLSESSTSEKKPLENKFSKNQKQPLETQGRENEKDLGMQSKAKAKELEEQFQQKTKNNLKSQIQDETTELEAQIKAKTKEFLYLQAEFENFKKQSFKERQQLMKYGASYLIQALADEVLDDLDRCLLSSSEDSQEIKKGLSMVHKKLQEVFIRFGIKTINPEGQVFDPNYQEALGQESSVDVPEGHVIKTFKPAYKLYDKVIRPAQVLVSKEVSKPADSSNDK